MAPPRVFPPQEVTSLGTRLAYSLDNFIVIDLVRGLDNEMLVFRVCSNQTFT